MSLQAGMSWTSHWAFGTSLFVLLFSEIELSAGNQPRDVVVTTAGSLVDSWRGSQALLPAI